MKAAVITDYNQLPVYQEIKRPSVNQDEVLLSVEAASVNHLVRARASGRHYSAKAALPLIPGNDGVGVDQAGHRYYFNANGSLAEQVAVSTPYLFELPQGGDAAVIAAAVNPAMSSYMALKARLGAAKVIGKTVLILGATGSAGQLAVQISKQLGAAKVIGVGRNPQRLAELPQLGADAVYALNDERELAAAVTDIASADIVLDYLWGTVAERFLHMMLPNRKNRHQPLCWLEIGSLAGADIKLSGAALRSTALSFLGSGMGSLSLADFHQYLPKLLTQIAAGKLVLPITQYPLDAIATHWNDSGNRLVFVP
ncbi:zinc-binding alcohol dehydrogenase family protein [uncultured Secundilactobacillus sp.]|uniref:quinone oxidoreductase family protein n=1 Tax=uncultured Secundilactobacillus sp. TaxID=2813935 RepID=UPI00258A0ADC|nr:zinc-binding alcohol dehydrogenase family protein [uncultured Secundilactobacillus sp.]